jgi:GC-rich sequence DNA-binding factor
LLDPASMPQRSSTGPTYDKAYLSELRASTPNARPHVGDEPYDADISLDPSDISAPFMEVDNLAGSSGPFLWSALADTSFHR